MVSRVSTVKKQSYCGGVYGFNVDRKTKFRGGQQQQQQRPRLLSKVSVRLRSFGEVEGRWLPRSTVTWKRLNSWTRQSWMKKEDPRSFPPQRS